MRGASKGEGLGNQFLGNIREVDAIVHVLRCFAGGDVTHVENKIDPIADAETVETELMLSDLESLEKRVPAFAKKAAQGDKESKAAASVLGQALDLLREGKPARLTQPKDEDEARIFGRLAASGWHTCGMTMRMLTDAWTVDGYFSLGGTGVDELRWTKPVYPGDVLGVRAEVLSKSAPRSRPELGFVNFFLTVVNQHEEVVMTMKVTNIQKRRPA